LTHDQRDKVIFQIGIPALALKSKPVYHALLAVSAACMCCDMMAKETTSDARAVGEILMTGYEHYNLASKMMRDMLSQPELSTPEPLLASAMLLVPFATASQQVNHWISCQVESPGSTKLLSTTPRDVIVVMRGIRTIIDALQSGAIAPAIHGAADVSLDLPSALLETNRSQTVAPSRTHVLYQTIATTSQQAFSKLQQHLELELLQQKTHYWTNAQTHQNTNRDQSPNESLSACIAAFEVLNKLRDGAFSASQASVVVESHETEAPSLPQLSAWFRGYVTRTNPPLQPEPLTRYLLSFLVQVPQEYLDIVLPLLDQRLERLDGVQINECTTELTREQALALDIYAHWSILMLLAEKEAWWIGILPFITMTGMINRYGEEFMSGFWPNCDSGHWWPGSMMRISREIRRF
jgi:hypothetical protein